MRQSSALSAAARTRTSTPSSSISGFAISSTAI
jgi:hypothetical protein